MPGKIGVTDSLAATFILTYTAFRSTAGRGKVKELLVVCHHRQRRPLGVIALNCFQLDGLGRLPRRLHRVCHRAAACATRASKSRSASAGHPLRPSAIARSAHVPTRRHAQQFGETLKRTARPRADNRRYADRRRAESDRRPRQTVMAAIARVVSHSQQPQMTDPYDLVHW